MSDDRTEQQRIADAATALRNHLKHNNLGEVAKGYKISLALQFGREQGLSIGPGNGQDPHPLVAEIASRV